MRSASFITRLSALPPVASQKRAVGEPIAATSCSPFSGVRRSDW